MLMDLSANYLMANLCLAPRGGRDEFHYGLQAAYSFTLATDVLLLPL
jgi:hypothetical protein